MTTDLCIGFLSRRTGWPLYAKFTLDFPDSPKIMPLSVEAKWALVEMTIYSRRMLTDGFISKPLALAKWGVDVCLALSTNDPTKPSLVEVENGYQIHDFAEHQSTRAEIEALTEKRRAAGQKGGQASAKARSKQVLKQKGSKSNPETETETHKPTTANAVVGRKRGPNRKRIPDGYMPQRSNIDKIRAEFPEITDPILKSAHEDFCLYWRGQGKPMADWEAVWLRWMRKELAKHTPSRSPSGGQVHKLRSYAELASEVRAEEQAQNPDVKELA
jgi:hypothetical protein